MIQWSYYKRRLNENYTLQGIYSRLVHLSQHKKFDEEGYLTATSELGSRGSDTNTIYHTQKGTVETKSLSEDYFG